MNMSGEMDRDQAIELLRHHSFTHPNVSHPKSEFGFLGMLRPFQGKLDEENYHEVMACVRCLAGELQDTRRVEKDIISPLWGICHLARAWGVDEGGMLRRNGLLSDEQIKTLDEWIDAISYATMLLLEGVDLDTAFELYEPRQESS